MATSSPNCLIVIPWELHHVGGVNQVFLNLLRELNRRGNIRTSVLISGYGHDEVTSEAGPDGRTPIYRLTVRNPTTSKGNLQTVLSFLARLPGTVRKLRRLLRTENVTVMNLHYPSLATLAFIVASRLSRPKVRLVLSFHGADFNQAEAAKGIRKVFWSFVLSKSDRIVTCSEALSRRLSRRFPHTSSRIHVVHNGVDQDILRRIADLGRVPAELEGKRFIFNAATLEAKKGQDTLMRAFAEIAPNYPDLVLAIMGREASFLGTLRELAAHLGIEDRAFIWTNVKHEDVMATMRKASVFALPSRIEPFGIVSLEAATFNVPVIASDVGGIPEIIESGKSGLLIEPDDVNELSRALTRLIDDRVLAMRLASNLHDVVAKRFTWRHTAAVYERLFGVGDAISGPGPQSAISEASRSD